MKTKNDGHVAITIYRRPEGYIRAVVYEAVSGGEMAMGAGLTVQAAVRELLKELDKMPPMESANETE